ncbi:hypothetical protein Hanom_Chr03g00217831 [Helianthus anomalus]
MMKLINNMKNQKEKQCRKCIEICSACTEKDENLRSRNIEFTKIENVFKEKCKYMFEKEEILKQTIQELTQNVTVLKKK